MSYNVGDSVMVKPGIFDPDLGFDMGGWQGRITETGEGEGGTEMVCIQWDSFTLKQMPGQVIQQCEEQGLDWTVIWLSAQEVAMTAPRDSSQNVVQVREALAAQSTWLHLGEQGRRIQDALHGVDEDDDAAAWSAWRRYLKRRLRFPFKATVIEHWMWGPISVGDRVEVKRLVGIGDPYGVLVEVLFEGDSRHFPLCDLEASNKDSPNYQLVDDYSTWFANR